MDAIEAMDEWTCLHFSQSNPIGKHQGNLPRLLRRVATTLEGRGNVRVLDMTLENDITDGDDWFSLTVYYVRDRDDDGESGPTGFANPS